MLNSEAFLQLFRPVDQVTTIPMYSANFELTQPGYNDDGFGHRILYFGQAAHIALTHEKIPEFLDAMPFAGDADRTNALAFALTCQLPRHWPGEKPVFPVTGTKSHCGKDTVIRFASGNQKIISVSYQTTNWALERSIVGVIKQNPDVTVICVENARIEKRRAIIASGFLERFVTDRCPFLFSTGTGTPVHVDNKYVTTLSTNDGTIGVDLMNRSCPIHLSPTGSIEDRESPIGNPKLEYLPQHRDRIEAELRGMIEKWKDAGRPLKTTVKHPCIKWAQTIGGILDVNGYDDFLANYTLRRSVDEPVRRALGLLGAASPPDWLQPTEWATVCHDLGLTTTIIPEADRGSDKGRARGIGVVMTNHRDETFSVETEDRKYLLKLLKNRSRFDGIPQTRYMFERLEEEGLPLDDEAESKVDPSESADDSR